MDDEEFIERIVRSHQIIAELTAQRKTESKFRSALLRDFSAKRGWPRMALAHAMGISPGRLDTLVAHAKLESTSADQEDE